MIQSLPLFFKEEKTFWRSERGKLHQLSGKFIYVEHSVKMILANKGEALLLTILLILSNYHHIICIGKFFLSSISGI